MEEGERPTLEKEAGQDNVVPDIYWRKKHGSLYLIS